MIRAAKKGLVWALILLLGLAAGEYGVQVLRVRILDDLSQRTGAYAAAFSAAELRQLHGDAADLASPAYVAAKARLAALQAANARIHVIYLLRCYPARKRAIYLADSQPARALGAAQPGDPDASAMQSPALRRSVLAWVPAADPPVPQAAAPIVLAFSPIGESYAAASGGREARDEVIGVEFSAGDWDLRLLVRAIECAGAVWLILGVPYGAALAGRKQREQRAALRNLLTAMEQSHTAIMIVNLGDRIEFANAGLLGQTGFNRRELLGRRWREFLPPDAKAELIAEMEAGVRTGRGWNGEWMNRRKDGQLYPVRGSLTPIRNRRGRPAGFVAAFEDMTEIRRNETTLRAALERAEAGDRTKSRFLATMSHEVRTPLNGIVGFTGLLLETLLNPEQAEYVQTIRTSGEALIQLTSDILDFARIESGGMKLELQPANPRSCVEDTLDLLAVQAANKGLELQHWVDDDVPGAVMADDSRVRQVLVNLVNNAVKFTETGLIELRVSARRPDGPEGGWLLTFSVRDTGIGIAPEHAELLFRPFRQVDETTTRRHGGTGLGLAICKNLVELMGGEIGFRSGAGAGSTFTFTLPAAEVVGMTGAGPSLSHLRLALVAPDGPFRDEFRRLAKRWGAHLAEPASAADLAGGSWDLAFVHLDAAQARDAAAQPAPWPVDRTYAVVSVALPSELRVALRPKFAQLINKPLHHDSLSSLLAGYRPTAAARKTEANFGLNVLVVEDNLVNQRLVQKILVNLGCKNTVAGNGRIALEMLARAPAPFDLILMDLHMPELDGQGAIEKIRAGEAGEGVRNIWITVLTADARASQKDKVMAVGANDYLVKPVSLGELSESLTRYKGASRTKSSGA